MAKRIMGWFSRRGERPFEAFQIEVTSRCNLRCVMCPVTVLADRWPALDLPWETFQRIARAFGKTKWVYLQGWGEPLLHPRILDMIALHIHRAGGTMGDPACLRRGALRDSAGSTWQRQRAGADADLGKPGLPRVP
jgi:hypothetical protein